MDVYTTSFTYPRRPLHIHSQSSSLDYAGSDVRAAGMLLCTHSGLSSAHCGPIPDLSTSPDSEAVQKLAMLAMTLHGCHVSYFPADHGRGWNFHITGAYQQVMVARGMILKECPIQVLGMFVQKSCSHFLL